jgi:hypothetical protein
MPLSPQIYNLYAAALPNWPDAPEHDPGVALIELLAYAGDL